MRHRQAGCHPQAAAEQHLEVLPSLATLRQMIFPHWVVGLHLHSNNNSNLHNSRRLNSNNSLSRHRMTITHLD
jgi:hypothetical protein